MSAARVWLERRVPGVEDCPIRELPVRTMTLEREHAVTNCL